MSELRLRYQTVTFSDRTDIHLRTLHDTMQFSDDDGEAEAFGISSSVWPLFGVIWDAGRVLAELMLHHEIDGLRILEVGCGLGLASLILNRRGADITATDWHPESATFLVENQALNGGPQIPFVRAGWSDPDCGLGTFDLIVAADVLYEQDQVKPLADFLDRHAGPDAEVIVVDGRKQRGRFERAMAARGFSHQRQRPNLPEGFDPGTFNGEVLSCVRGEGARPS